MSGFLRGLTHEPMILVVPQIDLDIASDLVVRGIHRFVGNRDWLGADPLQRAGELAAFARLEQRQRLADPVGFRLVPVRRDPNVGFNTLRFAIHFHGQGLLLSRCLHDVLVAVVVRFVRELHQPAGLPNLGPG